MQLCENPGGVGGGWQWTSSADPVKPHHFSQLVKRQIIQPWNICLKQKQEGSRIIYKFRENTKKNTTESREEESSSSSSSCTDFLTSSVNRNIWDKKNKTNLRYYIPKLPCAVSLSLYNNAYTVKSWEEEEEGRWRGSPGAEAEWMEDISSVSGEA